MSDKNNEHATKRVVFNINDDAFHPLKMTVSEQNKAMQKLAKNFTTALGVYSEANKAVLNNFQKNLAPLSKALASIISNSLSVQFPKIQEMTSTLERIMRSRHEFRQRTLESWNLLENELKTKNRYFPTSDFLAPFQLCMEYVGSNFRKGRMLYRARKIEIEDMSFEVKAILASAAESQSADQQQNKGNVLPDVWRYIEGLEQDEWKQDYIDKYSLQNNNFWGYSAKDSDAPPKNSKHGRVNPEGISYLYTALDANTAISEIQPTIGQIVSVAKIKTIKSLSIFKFDFFEAFKDAGIMQSTPAQVSEQLGISFWHLRDFFDLVSELFSKPATGNYENYYATQYISEFIKSKGFDGIEYKSSLKKGGTNIVLFDVSKDENGSPVNYEIVGTKLYKVSNVRVTSKQHLPR